MCQCQAVCKGFAFLYQGQRSPLLRRLSRLTPTHPKEHRLASQSPDERDNAPGDLSASLKHSRLRSRAAAVEQQ